MRAGQLRHVVVWQKPSATTDSHGDSVPGWSDVKSVRASIRTRSGGESEHTDQVQGEMVSEITYRAKAVAVTPGMRAVWNGRVFNVDRVDSFDNRDIMRVAHVREQVDA